MNLILRILGSVFAGLILCLVAVATLKFSYGFYLVLRILMFALLVFYFVSTWKFSKKWAVVFIPFAVVFNPFFPVHFYSRAAWYFVDVALLAVLVGWVWSFVFGHKNWESIQKELKNAKKSLEEQYAEVLRLRSENKNLRDESAQLEKVCQQWDAYAAELKRQLEQEKQQLEQEQAKNGVQKKSATPAEIADADKLKKLNDALAMAFVAWQKWRSVVRGDVKTAIGLRYEVFIAKKMEADGFDVELVGNTVWAYDLRCEHPTDGVFFVECKCWSKATILQLDDISRFTTHILNNPGSRGIIYTTTTLSSDAVEVCKDLGIRVYDKYATPGEVEMIRAYDGAYYTPIDAKYRNFKKSHDAVYYSTTFEAVLAGYKYGG